LILLLYWHVYTAISVEALYMAPHNEKKILKGVFCIEDYSTTVVQDKNKVLKRLGLFISMCPFVELTGWTSMLRRLRCNLP
jgi:hypothetical protein